MEIQKIAEHIIAWLKEYATQAGVKGFVVGVSGGIDSAVTSTLCARTGLPTVCVEMPIHQHPDQVNRAQEHILQLKARFTNVSGERVDLTESFETFKTAVPTTDNETILNLTLANTRARLRMTTLYYIAGLHSSLVAGTGNKVEDFGVGFYTKYGDGGVDISPIADLMKSEVFALGAYLEVPNTIQKAAPTDGLFGDSRTDEDQLGASYDELEWAMKQQDKGSLLNDFEGREKEVYAIYTKLNNANKHKMLEIPVCEIPETWK
ncbi:NAD(+) synthase [Wenyingzhuangia sp. 2_MG-2023]|uniref:NAD(+) synthase n=1 Tax=Wenyingzhuangia sp. 2_MG-2023 TaxID=3062639 RepID=UPI0026E39AC3|nr:NAD(+) synthase [Wenyingzhuangia sp. 2_MG-2023]MDO6736507.1 NAD(+) synthase [Wenyingzhuangia sp. 2_MG-2023]